MNIVILDHCTPLLKIGVICRIYAKTYAATISPEP